MKKDITNITTTLFSIKNTLLNDETIRKLLYYDTADALRREAPDRSLLEDGENGEKYITLYPIMEKGIIEFDRNTFIVITSPRADLDITSNNGYILFGVTLTVVTDFKHYKLENNKIRTLEICNRAITLLDNQKFNAAGKAEVMNIEDIIFDNYVYGYEIRLIFTDMGKESEF